MLFFFTLFMLKETYFSLIHTSIMLVLSFFVLMTFFCYDTVYVFNFVFQKTVVPTRFQHGRHCGGGGKTKQLLGIVALLFFPPSAGAH